MRRWIQPSVGMPMTGGVCPAAAVVPTTFPAGFHPW